MLYSPDTYSVVSFPLKHLPYLSKYSRFNASRPTIFYFHGWLESGDLDLSVLAIRGAYMDRGDHNVVSIDWSHYAKNINYRTIVIPQMKIVSRCEKKETFWDFIISIKIGETFAEYLMSFIENGYDISNIHLVGHSLGWENEILIIF